MSNQNRKQLVTINVSGELMTTPVRTFQKYPDSMLARMFETDENGQWTWSNTTDDNGLIYLDVDPTAFRLVLNFIRDGRLCSNSDVSDRVSDLYDISNYLQLEALSSYLDRRYPFLSLRSEYVMIMIGERRFIERKDLFLVQAYDSLIYYMIQRIEAQQCIGNNMIELHFPERNEESFRIIIKLLKMSQSVCNRSARTDLLDSFLNAEVSCVSKIVTLIDECHFFGIWGLTHEIEHFYHDATLDPSQRMNELARNYALKCFTEFRVARNMDQVPESLKLPPQSTYRIYSPFQHNLLVPIHRSYQGAPIVAQPNLGAPLAGLGVVGNAPIASSVVNQNEPPEPKLFNALDERHRKHLQIENIKLGKFVIKAEYIPKSIKWDQSIFAIAHFLETHLGVSIPSPKYLHVIFRMHVTSGPDGYEKFYINTADEWKVFLDEVKDLIGEETMKKTIDVNQPLPF